MKSTSDQRDQQIIEILKRMRSLNAEYPPELLAARRAAFIEQVVERRNAYVKEEQAAKDQEIIEVLGNLNSFQVEYPPELLASRRAAFSEQVLQQGELGASEAFAAQDQKLLEFFGGLKSVQTEYPPKLLAAQRAAFIHQVRGWGAVSLLDALYSAIHNKLSSITTAFSAPRMKVLRTSLVIAGVVAATFLGTVLGKRGGLQEFSNPSPTQGEIARPAPVLPTNTEEPDETICKPGYLPPLCLAQEFNQSQDLTFQGNGSARPAVAKDTMPGYSGVHKAAYVNDGLYGPGSSWVSNSAYSWIKIDLGKATAINTVTFGRDRLGHYSDRKPGQFVIAVALSDNVYADGNSSNDNIEYTPVYDSEQSGFTGTLSESQTVTATFRSVLARYVKITFENPGTAIDEVEVFMVQPVLAQSGRPTEKTKDRPPRATPTLIPTRTPRPTNTSTPIPTNTPQPSDTPTPLPTNTLTNTPIPTATKPPTNTPTPVPTNTIQPIVTMTPAPTNSPLPSSTPVLMPSETPFPVPMP